MGFTISGGYLIGLGFGLTDIYRSYTPSHPDKSLLRYRPQGSDCSMARGTCEWVRACYLSSFCDGS